MDIKKDWQGWCQCIRMITEVVVRANVNEVLAQELHKPVIKKFKRRKV